MNNFPDFKTSGRPHKFNMICNILNEKEIGEKFTLEEILVSLNIRENKFQKSTINMVVATIKILKTKGYIHKCEKVAHHNIKASYIRILLITK